MNALFSDPTALGMLIFGLVLIIGHFGIKWQDKIEKERAAKEQNHCS